MAMLLVVVSTEATDPTRVSGPISHNRRRHEDLIDEALWRNPFGCYGGRCRRNRPWRLTRESCQPNHGTSGPYH